ncbi:MAG: hypothetical protein ACSHWS_17410 [Sulfitobacter sp.]
MEHEHTTTAATLDTGQAQSKPNGFDRSEGYVVVLTALVFGLISIVSAYATYSGTQLFLNEVGGSSTMIQGSAILLTMATAAILMVGWNLIAVYGSEARTRPASAGMLGLGVIMLCMTFSISTLSNVTALAGPASKVHDWRVTVEESSYAIDQLETVSKGVIQLLPGWQAEANKACPAADQELRGGLVSGTGAGSGPVAFALSSLCQQSRSFVASMEAALTETDQAVIEARSALQLMRQAVRDRETAVLGREDRFLAAGDTLTTALQRLRAADLTEVLTAGAEQVQASVTELGQNSTFTRAQVETVRGIREGITGLVISTNRVTQHLRSQPVPERTVIRSPDYIEAIATHAFRFTPIMAAAIGIDLFQMWVLLFFRAAKAGRRHATAITSPTKGNEHA